MTFSSRTNIHFAGRPAGDILFAILVTECVIAFLSLYYWGIYRHASFPSNSFLGDPALRFEGVRSFDLAPGWRSALIVIGPALAFFIGVVFRAIGRGALLSRWSFVLVFLAANQPFISAIDRASPQLYAAVGVTLWALLFNAQESKRSFCSLIALAVASALNPFLLLLTFAYVKTRNWKKLFIVFSCFGLLRIFMGTADLFKAPLIITAVHPDSLTYNDFSLFNSVYHLLDLCGLEWSGGALAISTLLVVGLTAQSFIGGMSLWRHMVVWVTLAVVLPVRSSNDTAVVWLSVLTIWIISTKAGSWKGFGAVMLGSIALAPTKLLFGPNSGWSIGSLVNPLLLFSAACAVTFSSQFSKTITARAETMWRKLHSFDTRRNVGYCLLWLGSGTVSISALCFEPDGSSLGSPGAMVRSPAQVLLAAACAVLHAGACRMLWLSWRNRNVRTSEQSHRALE